MRSVRKGASHLMPGLPALYDHDQSFRKESPVQVNDQLTDTAFPRPSLRHHAPWFSLDGPWEFEFDPKGLGQGCSHWLSPSFAHRIRVPFCYQSPLSGIGTNQVCDHVWYALDFDLPRTFGTEEVVRLHFGAVDYRCRVWLNGTEVGSHLGGHVPFSFDITPWVKSTRNRVVLWVEDLLDPRQPRGKQYYKPEPESVFYTRTTGIWQTVWLEILPQAHFSEVRLTPFPDPWRIRIQAILTQVLEGTEVSGRLLLNDETVQGFQSFISGNLIDLTVPVDDPRMWTPERPNLYQVELRLGHDGDCVQSECGLRSVTAEDHRVFLNGEPCFLRLVLDQGYWHDGIMTALSPDEFKKDIQLAKSMGFNGCRKHQKIEDPRFLYYADHLGFLVWSEMPNFYQYSPEVEEPFLSELLSSIRRDHNHPSVMAYVPFNESWGLMPFDDPAPMEFVRRVLRTIRQIDSTRLVVDNDGWMHEDTDLFTIHEYTSDPVVLRRLLEEFAQGRFENWRTCAPYEGVSLCLSEDAWKGQPLVISECGGLGFQVKQISQKQEVWGYHGVIQSEEEFLSRFALIIEVLSTVPRVAGYCYTQLTDVEQEINGLMTSKHECKIPPSRIREIVLQSHTLESASAISGEKVESDGGESESIA